MGPLPSPYDPALPSPHLGPAPRPGPGPQSGTVPRPFALLNDEPVASGDDDLLGARRAAFQLASLLRGSYRSTPFTLAIDAGWGMGKSTLMRLVDAELSAPAAPGEPGPAVHTVWYNAWTSTGGDALEGLIKSVLNGFDPNVLRRGLRRVSEHRALIRVLRTLVMVLAGPLGIARMIDELWKSMSVDPKARNEMRDALRDLVADWSGTTAHHPGRMLVVFIDDLDRCEESTVLAVCEAVKIYLDVPGLAFVIGCDRAAIGPGGLLRDLSPAGAAFMEKIFQTSYRVPAGSPDEIRAYVYRCARDAGIAHLLDDNLADLLAYRAARNPRRIKRLVNGLLLEARLNPIWDGVGPEAVIRTLLLQYLYPDFYRMMTVPAGPVSGDVVGEFTEYRQVRTVLRAQTPPAPEHVAMATAFLRQHGVPPMDVTAHPAGALAELEQQLPTDFPVLALDQSFTSLVDELLAVDGAEQVLRRLREGLDTTPVAASLPERPQQPGTIGLPPPTGAVEVEYGLFVYSHDILITRAVFEALVPAGYFPYQAINRLEANMQFEPSMGGTLRLLICDVDLEEGVDAGFDYVQELRDTHTYDGPVIFFTNRHTPARLSRATDMGAELVTDVQRLPALVSRILAASGGTGSSGAT